MYFLSFFISTFMHVISFRGIRGRYVPNEDFTTRGGSETGSALQILVDGTYSMRAS